MGLFEVRKEIRHWQMVWVTSENDSPEQSVAEDKINQYRLEEARIVTSMQLELQR